MHDDRDTNLVSCPIPEGGSRLSEDKPWPGQVRVHGVAEQVEVIIPGQATGVVGVERRVGNGLLVERLQILVTTDLVKAWEIAAKTQTSD